MEQILSVLYGVSGITAAALYIPQIMKYQRDPEACKAISLLSWGGWIAIAAVTILYAVYVVKSMLFATVAVVNVVAQITVLFYGVRARVSIPFPALAGSKSLIAETIARPIEAAIETGGPGRSNTAQQR